MFFYLILTAARVYGTEVVARSRPLQLLDQDCLIVDEWEWLKPFFSDFATRDEEYDGDGSYDGLEYFPQLFEGGEGIRAWGLRHYGMGFELELVMVPTPIEGPYPFLREDLEVGDGLGRVGSQ